MELDLSECEHNFEEEFPYSVKLNLDTPECLAWLGENADSIQWLDIDSEVVLLKDEIRFKDKGAAMFFKLQWYAGS